MYMPAHFEETRPEVLHALVREHLQLDAFAGHLYLFANRRKDRLKILYWGVSRM